ncbi:MAG: ABC transporter ATP-binding protein [Desulforudis sp.]|jgi:lipopolysaccharide transport system ATP-binding protein|nr:MAG: ABC transporter ATP-binding protein [Desulforudis sp.]
MTDTVIKVEDLSKSYLIGHQSQERYTALRDVMANKVKSLGERLLHPFRSSEGGLIAADVTEEFWALKDVSFEVKRGDRVGIIGRNGAGKSTLLKILSRITEPTSGRIEIEGRVASLLEVGTGFHPELTGRENIYLNGAILGMGKAEIKRKFDEIVAFAEVERFLDTPVKRYSSGMYVRLAFAVAAHLEPEILVVDEVLAVGDAQFQKKCLGKMEEVSRGGRTVLFVSHNMSAIQKLCTQGALFDHGLLKFHGNIQSAIFNYTGKLDQLTRVDFECCKSHPCIKFVIVEPDALRRGDLLIKIGFESPFPLNPPIPGIVISSLAGANVFGSNPRFHSHKLDGMKSSSGVVQMFAKSLPLVSGQYRLSVWLGDWHVDYDHKIDVFSFEFKSGLREPLRPNPESVGYLDWSAEWSYS